MSNVRDRWIAEVLRSHRIGDACRVLLLAMSSEMSENGTVSIGRARLAGTLRRHPQRVAERVAEARAAGLLDLVAKARKGSPAEYVAVIPAGIAYRSAVRNPGDPSVDCVPICSTQSAARSVRNPRSANSESERVPIRESSVSVSEHPAVDQGRERRDDHDGSRDSLDHNDKDGSNEDQVDDRLPVDAAVDLDGLPTRQPSEADPHGDRSSVTREAADTITDHRLAAFALVRAVLDDDAYAAATISTDPTALALAGELARAVRAVAFTEGVTEGEVVDASVRRIIRLAANP